MQKPSFFILRFLLLFFFTAALLLNFNIHHEQQFAYIADSFLHGKLYFLEKPGTWFDSVMYNGKAYWPLGLSPVLLLIPFVALFKTMGLVFYQGYLQIILTFGIFYMSYWLAKKHSYRHEDALWLAFAFCFGSVNLIVALISWGWYFAQAVVVVFVFLSIVEWHRKKRYWFIGICYGIVMAARFTAVFGILFFIADLIFRRKKLPRRQLAGHLLQLFIPVIISGLCLLWYNAARFENPLDNGYMSVNNWTLPEERRFETLNYGLFQLRNIPMNIYYYFIKTLDPVRVDHFADFGQTFILRPPYIKLTYPGTSFFVASPIFLYVFYALRKKFKTREVWLSSIPVVVILSLLLTFYWTGWRQIGPRYTLDFLPFLYLILLHSFNKYRLSALAKVVIGSSAILNFYLLYCALTTS